MMFERLQKECEILNNKMLDCIDEQDFSLYDELFKVYSNLSESITILINYECDFKNNSL